MKLFRYEVSKIDKKQWPKLILLLIPAIIGFYGFIQLDGITLPWALYYTIRLYGINTDVNKINIWIEIARWLAPIATAGAILTAIKTLRESCTDWWRSRSQESCSVYGDNQDAKLFLENLGEQGVNGYAHKIRPTPYHVIMLENNQATLDFYTQHKEDLGKYRVYLALDGISPLSIHSKNVTAFSNAENCAALYWQQNPAKQQERIAIIGDNTICEALLTRGLVLNIFSTEQQIEYHIWSDTEYQLWHQQLSQIKMDKIIFHNQPYTHELALLASMDRIILCASEDENLILTGKLKAYTICPIIHVKSHSEEGFRALYGNESIEYFGNAKDLLTREIIIQEMLLNNAKKIHNHYQSKYPTMPNWEQLEIFKRKSNVSAADYFPVIQHLHDALDMDIEMLSELEHIRWSRFHYLNNWQYGPTRNDALRIHNCLIPYNELTEEEKQKDRENVLLALNPAFRKH